MNTTKIRLTAAVFLALAATATSTQAQTYAKVGTNQDSLPATAQITQGVGDLQEITGVFTFTTIGTERTVANVSNPDLFEIRIDGSTPFSATTIGQVSNIFDTQLFLFDAAGKGVYANDNASDFTTKSLLDPTTTPAPGLYFLGIATYGAVPRSGSGATFDIFDNPIDDTSGSVSFTGLKGPKSGATGPLTNWFLSGANVETGYYSIALTGASYASAPVPEASTTVSFGLLLALGGLVIAAKRKKASA